jgi:predicted protein tyrosine phosphatase
VSWLDERGRNGGLDEVALPDGVPGRLWLCGKHFIGPDPDEAVARTAADVVVCLNERHELAPRYPDYVAWLEAHAAVDPDDAAAGRARWFPVPDLHAPSVDEVAPLVGGLAARIRAGDSVLVHCGAGIGRAGTIAAAILMHLGMSLDDALSHVHVSRPGAGPQADVQTALLLALEAAPD